MFSNMFSCYIIIIIIIILIIIIIQQFIRRHIMSESLERHLTTSNANKWDANSYYMLLFSMAFLYGKNKT